MNLLGVSELSGKRLTIWRFNLLHTSCSCYVHFHSPKWVKKWERLRCRFAPNRKPILCSQVSLPCPHFNALEACTANNAMRQRATYWLRPSLLGQHYSQLPMSDVFKETLSQNPFSNTEWGSGFFSPSCSFNITVFYTGGHSRSNVNYQGSPYAYKVSNVNMATIRVPHAAIKYLT